MLANSSFQLNTSLPSAIISDGALVVPLWAVTQMSLSETYHLPALGSSGMKAVVATHDDSITLSGLLIGPDRYLWKLYLERLAETSKAGSALSAITGGKVGGLILITTLAIRTDMQVKSLSFSVSAAKRDVIDVSLALDYMPLPGALGKLLDLASIGVAALADMGGN